MGLTLTQATAPRRDRGTGVHATWARTDPATTRPRRDWQTRWNQSLTPRQRLTAAISLVLSALVQLRKVDPDRHATVMDETAWKLYHLAAAIRSTAGVRS